MQHVMLHHMHLQNTFWDSGTFLFQFEIFVLKFTMLISLDASKVFDKLWRDGLFYKLIKVLDKRIWRILYYYYKISKITIKYNGENSIPLRITAGVKQGGVLSPHFFNYFLNEWIDNWMFKSGLWSKNKWNQLIYNCILWWLN